jgi:hypothetical protein
MVSSVTSTNQSHTGAVRTHTAFDLHPATQDFETGAELLISTLERKLSAGPPGDQVIAPDLLTELFGVTPEQIRAHHQFYNTNLGILVENLVFSFLQAYSTLPVTRKLKDGTLELADIVHGQSPDGTDRDGAVHFMSSPPTAMEIKYRYGSQDSKHVRSTAQRAQTLVNMGFEPLMWIFREDSAPSNLHACKNAGWRVVEGPEAFDWLAQQCRGARLDDWLAAHDRTAAELNPLGTNNQVTIT